MTIETGQPDTRTRLLDAALELIRRQGYSGTSVGDLCRAAGVTKGGFFHHFASKQDLATAAADRFAELANALFDAGEHHDIDDPRAKLLGYVDLRIGMIGGLPIFAFSCFFGTLVQEVHESNADIRHAAGRHIVGHVEDLAKLVAAAKAACAPDADWEPLSVAYHMQVVLQGAIVMAKATQDPQRATDSLRHLRRYLEHLLPETP